VGAAAISVDTYDGATYIGTDYLNFNIASPASVIPTCTSITASGVDSGANYATYGYVEGKSKSALTINGASGIYGSTITAYSITGGGFTGTTSTYTTGVLNTSGNITFTAKVQDSRGRWSADRTVSISVNAYSSPSILTYTAERCLTNGALNGDGTYVKALTTFSYSTVGGNNAIISNIKYRKMGVATWSSITNIASNATGVIVGEGLIDTTSSYEVILTLSDNFTTVTKTIVVATAFVTLDFKTGGKGISIGKSSETNNLFDIAMDTKITGTLTTGNNINLNNLCRLDAANGALRLYTSEVGFADYGLRLD
jgi:hypothetical protein